MVILLQRAFVFDKVFIVSVGGGIAAERGNRPVANGFGRMMCIYSVGNASSCFIE